MTQLFSCAHLYSWNKSVFWKPPQKRLWRIIFAHFSFEKFSCEFWVLSYTRKKRRKNEKISNDQIPSEMTYMVHIWTFFESFLTHFQNGFTRRKRFNVPSKMDVHIEKKRFTSEGDHCVFGGLKNFFIFL